MIFKPAAARVSTRMDRIAQSFHPRPASQGIKIVGWHIVLGALVSVLGFSLFMAVADWVTDGARGAVRFDRTVLLWLHARQRPGLTELARILAFLGSPPVIVAIALIAAVVGKFARHLRGAAWTLPFAVVGAGVIIQGIKLFVHRARPDLFKPLLHETGYSFPSGHSLIAVAVYGLLGYFALHLAKSRAARVAVISLTVLLIFLIGISRPYVGVHYPTDVLAGWAMGVPWLVTCLGLHEVLARRYKKAGEPVLGKIPPMSRAVDRHNRT
jgi:undecaprenyl-diphosphatase